MQTLRSCGYETFCDPRTARVRLPMVASAVVRSQGQARPAPGDHGHRVPRGARGPIAIAAARVSRGRVLHSRRVSNHGRRHRGAELRLTGAAGCTLGEAVGLVPMSFPMSITVAIAATHVFLHIVKTSPNGPCRLEKTLSPAISSGRRRPAPMQIAAGPAIGSRCPLDCDRTIFKSAAACVFAVPSMPQDLRRT